MMRQFNLTKPNEAWVLYREDIETKKEGNCNAYILLDAYSTFCFIIEVFEDLPPKSNIIHFLKIAYDKAGRWPKQILISKKDPYLEIFISICDEFKIKVTNLPAKELKKIVRPFLDSFNQFKYGDNPHLEKPSDSETEELEAYIPETYGPCPCASGKQFKYCCQQIFRDISFAMYAAEEEGNLEEALHFMKIAESKVGMTAEILCRYSICWSFFDAKKSQEYLSKAIQVNPNHPRTNYILGIEAVANQCHEAAIHYYKKAIDHYPKEDKYHLNETYNNLGSVYYRLKKYQEAKEAWEIGFLLLPTDEMIKKNLIVCIYENPDVPENIREISPFMKQYWLNLHKKIL